MTGHWIDREWHLHDVLLDVVEVKSDHSGRNIAKHVMKSLNDFGVANKLFCITGDNASSNTTMALAIKEVLPDFKYDQQLLGCVGHVLNIAAKKGSKPYVLTTTSTYPN